MTRIPAAALAAILTCALAAPVLPQSFTLSGKRTSAWAPSSSVTFSVARPAQKLQWAFIPPARKMFADLSGNAILFPPLYPRRIFFEKVTTPPAFMASAFNGAFTTWRLGDFYLALGPGYTGGPGSA